MYQFSFNCNNLLISCIIYSILKFQSTKGKKITPIIYLCVYFFFSHWQMRKTDTVFLRKPVLECIVTLSVCSVVVLSADTIGSGTTKNRFHFVWVSVTADTALFSLLVLSLDTHPFEEQWFMMEVIALVSVPADNTPTAFVCRPSGVAGDIRSQSGSCLLSSPCDNCRRYASALKLGSS